MTRPLGATGAARMFMLFRAPDRCRSLCGNDRVQSFHTDPSCGARACSADTGGRGCRQRRRRRSAAGNDVAAGTW